MNEITPFKIQKVRQQANLIRQDVLEMLTVAGSGHTGGSLGTADIFAVLYWHTLNHRPKQPAWSGRDRFLLSNGHICPIWYAALIRVGYLAAKFRKQLRQMGSPLQGHPHYQMPGVDLASGSLGQGIGVATGLALAATKDKLKWRVYCMVGDGELQEGSVWEALSFASHYNLENLTLIVDRNNRQIDGDTEDVMALEPLSSKLKSFGWQVLEVDGHNIQRLMEAFQEAEHSHHSPTIIVAKTVLGKGVPSIENDYAWHGKAPSKLEGASFISELNL